MGEILGISYSKGGINNLHWEMRKGGSHKNCPDRDKHSIVERCPSCSFSINDQEDWDGDTAETASSI